jgi:hypothetical protein
MLPGCGVVLKGFTQDLKVSKPNAHGNGLGVDQNIMLKPTGAAADSVYDSEAVPIDPTKTRTITATVFFDGDKASDAYRTVGS